MKKSNRKAVLDYRNERVIRSLASELSLSGSEAEQLFNDVLSFMYSCSQSSLPLAPPMRIDEGWHRFILFSKDYSEFCHSYFGVYVHHEPAVAGTVAGINESLEVLHQRTLVTAKELGLPLGTNWFSGVDALNWCCGHVPSPAPVAIPEEEAVAA